MLPPPFRGFQPLTHGGYSPPQRQKNIVTDFATRPFLGGQSKISANVFLSLRLFFCRQTATAYKKRLPEGSPTSYNRCAVGDLSANFAQQYFPAERAQVPSPDCPTLDQQRNQTPKNMTGQGGIMDRILTYDEALEAWEEACCTLGSVNDFIANLEPSCEEKGQHFMVRASLERILWLTEQLNPQYLCNLEGSQPIQ